MQQSTISNVGYSEISLADISICLKFDAEIQSLLENLSS